MTDTQKPGDFQSRKILFIDDNELNRKLVRSIAGKMGCIFFDASNAQTGIDLARSELPDVILMDIHLPGMDGLAATKVLKQDPATSSIPVIAFTASAMKGDREKILAAGCDDYISKPIGYRELVGKLQEWLAKDLQGISPDQK